MSEPTVTMSTGGQSVTLSAKTFAKLPAPADKLRSQEQASLDDNTGTREELEPGTIRINDKLTVTRNPGDLRCIFEHVLQELDSNYISSNMFAIVRRNAEKPASFVAVMKVLKPEEKIFYRACEECPQAEFILIIDKLQFDGMDQEDFETELKSLLRRIHLNIETGKYGISKPDLKIYLADIREQGEDHPAVKAIERTLKVHNKEKGADA